MIHQRGITRNAGIPVQHQQFTPTISVFPHTTLANVAIPLDTFKSRDVSSVGTLYDTPGIEGDSAYLTSLISHDYARNTSLLKLTGFQRPPDKLEPGIFSLLEID
jgi:hypothetical protein